MLFASSAIGCSDGSVTMHESTTRELRDEEPVRLLSFALTDYGNAERFVARYRDRVRFCPPRRSWLMWDERRWRWDETGDVVRLAKRTVREIYREASAAKSDEQRQAIARHAAKSESATRINALLELAKTEEGIPVLPADLDADHWLLTVENGTIDLRTGVLREHQQSDLITKMAPVAYDPAAKSELWDRCLRDATGGDDDLTGYLQRIFGYSLTGDASEKALFFFFGPPNTAKSTVLGAWAHTLGDYAASAGFETWCARRDVGGNRGDLVKLMGARLVSSVETKRGAKLDEGLVKKVTGGDPIDAAAKYEAEITFVCTFTLVLAANDAPRIRDDDDGLWARMQRVPFTNVIADPDPKFREQLCAPEVVAAILAWGVQGCLEWQSTGLKPPASVLDSTAAYRAESDRFVGFADSELRFEADATIPRKRLREIYERWCEDEGIKGVGARELAERMRDAGASERKSDGKRLWVNVREQYAYESAAGQEGT